jgi:hypothetical protein
MNDVIESHGIRGNKLDAIKQPPQSLRFLHWEIGNFFANFICERSREVALTG